MVVPIISESLGQEEIVKNRLAWMFVSVVSFALPSNGCHITTCEHGSVCSGPDDVRDREDSCRLLCDRLVVCGNVATPDHDACMSSCYDEYDRDPSGTSVGCRCASRASCSEISDRHCPTAPPIGGGYGTTGSTVTVGGTGSGSVTVGSTVTGSGAGGSSGSTSSSAGTGGGCCTTSSGSTTSTTSSSTTTSGTGGQPGSGGAPGHDAGTPTDGGPATCGD
jgi:hypothetical protein